MKQINNILLIGIACVFFFACQRDELSTQENVGYLRVALEQSTEVNTKADATYKPKQMRVVIKNSAGMTKFETNDHTADLEGKELSLKQGEYTIEAVSYGWDGNAGADCAYYTGKTTVTIEKGKTATANLVCSLANVKVTVAFEQAFLDKLGNGSINVQVKSATTTVTPVDFAPKGTSVAYFPVSDLTVTYTVVSAAGKMSSNELPISEVSAKDHYILNFKNQAAGTGNVTVTVDPTMNQYTYDFTIDPNAKSGATLSANPWSQLAYLTATDITLDSGDLSSLKFQYRPKNTDTWMDVATTVNTAASSATATLTGLTSATAYEYQLTDGEISIAKVEFTTETEIALQNGNLDAWTGNPDSETVSPNSPSDSKFWDTSNTGANTITKKNPTRGVTSPVHTEGGMAAQLESKKVISFFAAASLYTGSFGKVSIPNAIVNFGQPFTSRPVALKGFYQYKPVVIDIVGGNAPEGVKAGDMDQCAIYIALAKKAYTINNGDLSSFINFKDDPNIIAYGELPSGAATEGDGYVEFNIPLKYKNLTDQPTHIIVVCSSSKYGDYMTGGVGSTLYVDDLSLIYDGTPTIWE
ncbi:lipoprotein [Parabacteroides distasonis]|jgi:hypothetical protein|uniref:DUF4493 domain-containing protein n=1 Tax=Parabacteroides distasonis TaxID=823 RepID=UPI000B6AD658|nr:PCMD domain-containing protein [Parabacteroides distasonis]PNL07644.1 hypothetical protein CEQ22_006030 [Parabacteroides distasonis]QRO15354.1 PCMD domain-containing protein [Parabacteroides distasonis]UEB10182.1 PCMD domain-containing protein [Parabacteroides distasonis]SUV25728.1 lipoprotein [Parabacteroides distasonis]